MSCRTSTQREPECTAVKRGMRPVQDGERRRQHQPSWDVAGSGHAWSTCSRGLAVWNYMRQELFSETLITHTKTRATHKLGLLWAHLKTKTSIWTNASVFVMRSLSLSDIPPLQSPPLLDAKFSICSLNYCPQTWKSTSVFWSLMPPAPPHPTHRWWSGSCRKTLPLAGFTAKLQCEATFSK